MCQPVGMQSEKPFYHALTDWPCTPSTGVNTRGKALHFFQYLSYKHSPEWVEKLGNTSSCVATPLVFSSLLVFCSAAVALKNKFASIYGSAGFESFRCNGVRGVDECGYLCWRHWDAGQGSIRLAEPSHPCGQYATAPLTLIHIALHLHPTPPKALVLDRLGCFSSS